MRENGRGLAGKMQASNRLADLRVSGMACASCTGAVERALLGLNGVARASVSLAGESASVEYDPKRLSLPQIEAAIRSAGYDVIDDKAIIRIGGMACAICVSAIEIALKKLDGVLEARVNLAGEVAIVTFNPRMVGLSDMKRAVEDAGYQYLGLSGEEESLKLEKEAIVRDMAQKKRRIAVGLIASAVLMAMMYLPLHQLMPASLHMASSEIMGLLMLVISAPAFVYVSHPIFRAAIRALSNKSLDMDVMYGMGIGVAYASSILGTFSIVLTPDFMFYETAVMLATFLTLGRYLEARAKGRTSEAIKRLVGLAPKRARLLKDGVEIEVLAEEVLAGDVLVVRPGERIAADGEVLFGESYLDESMITGESLPVKKQAASQVVGGTLNLNGSFQFRATRVGRETQLSRIISLVQAAQSSRPPVQRIADRAVAFFIPVILMIAGASFVCWYYIAHNTLLFSLTALISVLVVACPCALGLATPTAITVGIGRGAELGILIKSGEALEASEKLDAIAFDKTGTLTEGRPTVTDVAVLSEAVSALAPVPAFTSASSSTTPYAPVSVTTTTVSASAPDSTTNSTTKAALPVDGAGLLHLAASAERLSEHPLAGAVLRRAEELGIALASAGGFEARAGRGVLAEVEGHRVAVGNRGLFADEGISIDPKLSEAASGYERMARTALFVAIDGLACGALAISDRLKPSARHSVSALQRMGLLVVMITGDNSRSADAVAEQLGIEQVYSEVMPEDKSREIMKMQEQGHKVAFVGDGINDAPALAQADVGIAIGGGTDVAIEAGDIVLMRDDLLHAVAAIQLGRKVISRVKQNIFWAFAYNALLVPVAAGALYPVFGITFRPELAGLAMAASSVTVVSLSLLLKRYVPPVLESIGPERISGSEKES